MPVHRAPGLRATGAWPRDASTCPGCARAPSEMDCERDNRGAAMTSDLNKLRDQYHQSVAASIQGDPDVQKPLWSRREQRPDDDGLLFHFLVPAAWCWDDIVFT